MTTRNFINNTTNDSTDELATRYTSMLNKVANMIENQGPIYSTWIRFQLGDQDAITFNTASTDKKENLIASLRMEKNGTGKANSFTLVVKYDPFNYGQNSDDKIEALDDLLANAMAYSVDEDGTLDSSKLQGTIQYGYNYTGDNNIVSPKYSMMLTNASSSVDWSSGITSYTFEGCSFISLDAEFTANFDEITEDDNRGLLSVVCKTLYYYYGDPDNPPSQITDTSTYGGNYKYKIEIADSLFADEVTVTADASSGISPWTYCKNLLEGKMSKTDTESGAYDDVVTTLRPRYSLFISDATQTIYVTYVSPKSEDANIYIDYDFTWSYQTKRNLVHEWNPEVDLRIYFLYKAKKARLQEKLNSTDEDVVSAAQADLDTINSSEYERYNATITLMGIPSDPPIDACIRVKPRVLESVSRTAGVYMITGSTDTISTKGIYESELNLFRMKGL